MNVGKNHYCFTAFIKTHDDLYVYISIPDVRFWKNEWYNHILIREAKDEKDYHGGEIIILRSLNFLEKCFRLQYHSNL